MSKESLVTVLDVEGHVLYNACRNCTTKVELVPHTNRGWCKKCNACTNNPQPRYRLSLRVCHNTVPHSISLFGHAAVELFGCTVTHFLKKAQELGLTEDQMKLAVQRSLHSEVIKITTSPNNVVTEACFVGPTALVVLQQLDKLDTTCSEVSRSTPDSLEALLKQPVLVRDTILDKEYEMFFSSPESPEPDKTTPESPETADLHPQQFRAPHNPSHELNNPKILNSTPLFSQLKYKSFINTQDTMVSPILVLHDHEKSKLIPHFPPCDLNDTEDILSDPKFLPPQNHISSTKSHRSCGGPPSEGLSGSDSYSRVNEKRRKRRRCRVQCLVADQPTQVFEQSRVISAPDFRNLDADKPSSEQPDVNVRQISYACRNSWDVPQNEASHMPQNETSQMTQNETSHDKIPYVSPDKNTSTNSSSTESLVSELDSKELRALDEIDEFLKFNHPTNSPCTTTKTAPQSTASVDLINEIQEIDSVQPPTETIDTFPTQPPTGVDDEILAELMISDDSIFDQISETERPTNQEPHKPLKPSSFSQFLNNSMFDNLSLDECAQVVPETLKDEPKCLSSGKTLQEKSSGSGSTTTTVSLADNEVTSRSDDSSVDLFGGGEEEEEEEEAMECSAVTSSGFGGSSTEIEKFLVKLGESGRTQKADAVESSPYSDTSLKHVSGEFDWSKMSSQDLAERFDFRLSESDSNSSSADLF